jgi:flagellar FliL protein
MAAAQPAARAGAPAASGGGFGQLLIALIVVTVLSGAVGAVFAPRSASPQHGQNAKDAATNESSGASAVVAPTSNIIDLPPIVTNLGAPSELWVRLETSMIFDSSATQHPETLAAEIANDLLAYLRTVSVAQIQGPIGMQNLRQDINERAAIRSAGAVKELVIRTLVIQ